MEKEPDFTKSGSFSCTVLVVFRQVIAVSIDQLIHHLFDGIDIQLAAGVRIEHRRLIDVLLLLGDSRLYREKLWVDVLDAGAVGIILKTGELLTQTDVNAVMEGKQLVFNYPILEKIVQRFRQSVLADVRRQEALIQFEIDEYDERYLRHLALGYTKEMIASLKGMPFGVKSLEKRQNELINRLFTPDERSGINATRLVVKALQVGILHLDQLEPDDE